MTAIKVENLSKRYIIDHQRQQSHYHYNTLGGTLTNLGKQAFHYLRHPSSLINNTLEHEEFWALKDINFEIQQGDRVGIIGRNGAGKSTLLKILSRITSPTSGKITINGRVSSLLEVGTGFHPELTGRENIFLNGAILGMKRQEIKNKFDEIVAFAEVEKFLDTPVKHYSSGMYVRLAFAVAAHLEPEILIVDEVLAVGDMQFQKKCLGKMEEVSREGRTILFVSHNFASLKALCTTGILIDKGAVILQSNLDKVTEKYSNLITTKPDIFHKLITPSADIYNISLCNIVGELIDHIDTSTDIFINIDYEVKKTKQVNMVLNLLKEGQIIFQSINNNDPSFYSKKNPGKYRNICHIPKNFLNNGHFTLGITIFEENYTIPIEFKDICYFSIEDSPSIRGDYFGGISGSIRPRLCWKSKKI